MSPSVSVRDDEVALLRFNQQLEINQTLTALYLIVEVGRCECTQTSQPEIRKSIGNVSICYLPLSLKDSF